jgi:hypothetical protein
MPTVKSSSTTPISAIDSTCAGSEMRPKPYGPQITPVMRKPTIGGTFARWKSSTTATPRPNSVSRSWRNPGSFIGCRVQMQVMLRMVRHTF